jgi:2-polyprenyl-3-methyl-5-hydroxy-6-metoxy-1,4-benzoquinol methylase
MIACIDCEQKNLLPAYLRSPKDNNFTVPIADLVEPSDEHYLIISCQDCSSTFLHPYYFDESFGLYDTQRYFDEYFPDNIHTGGGPKTGVAKFPTYTRWVNKRRAAKFLSLAGLPQNRETRVVDIGCGKGDLVLGFVDCDCDAIGVEVSEQMVSEAVSRGVKALHGRFEDVDVSTSSVDLITSIEVFEHMAGLSKILTKVRQSMKPDGALILQVPNDIDGYRSSLFRRIWWMVPPMHIRYFTRRSVETIFGQYGFDILKIRTQGSVGADLGRILTWWLKRLGFGQIEKRLPYALFLKLIAAILFPIDIILNGFAKHSELILVLKNTNAKQ